VNLQRPRIPAARDSTHPEHVGQTKLLLWHDLRREVLAHGESAALLPPFCMTFFAARDVPIHAAAPTVPHRPRRAAPPGRIVAGFWILDNVQASRSVLLW
jgi:hypothetical protein